MHFRPHAGLHRHHPLNHEAASLALNSTNSPDMRLRTPPARDYKPAWESRHEPAARDHFWFCTSDGLLSVSFTPLPGRAFTEPQVRVPTTLERTSNITKGCTIPVVGIMSTGMPKATGRRSGGLGDPL